MKTFSDLDFKNHPAAPYFSEQATIHFDNEYGVSVVNGRMANCGDDTYEVAILYKYKLCYTTPLTDDVIGYCSPDRITEIMEQVQNL